MLTANSVMEQGFLILKLGEKFPYFSVFCNFAFPPLFSKKDPTKELFDKEVCKNIMRSSSLYKQKLNSKPKKPDLKSKKAILKETKEAEFLGRKNHEKSLKRKKINSKLEALVAKRKKIY